MKHNAAHYLALITGIILIVLATTTLTGCAMLDQRDMNGDGVVDRDEAVSWYQRKIEKARSINADYSSFVDSLAAQIKDIDIAIEQAETGSSDWFELNKARARLIEWRDKAQGVADGADSTITRITELIENMPPGWTNAGAVDGGVIGEGIKTAAPLLPPPWNIIAYSVAGLVPILGKKVYDLKGERDTLIYANDEIKRTDPEFAKAFDRNTDRIRAIHGRKLAQKVDKIRAPITDKFPVSPPPDMRQ